MSRTRKDMRCQHNGHKWKNYVHWYYNWWSCSEPKWWRKMYKHKPRRRELRRALHEAMNEDVDAVVWPMDVKPWVYYF